MPYLAPDLLIRTMTLLLPFVIVWLSNLYHHSRSVTHHLLAACVYLAVFCPQANQSSHSLVTPHFPGKGACQYSK